MQNPTAEQPSIAAYAALPTSFEANYGQTEAAVKFMARGSGYTLLLTAEGAILVVQCNHTRRKVHSLSKKDMIRQARVTKATLSMNLAGADPQLQVEGLEKLPGIVNYFIGNDPAQWRTEIPTYKKIRYRNVYPGVDMIYYGKQGQLEYDFVLAPGTDPSIITLDFQGLDQLELADCGDLVLHVSGEQIRLRKPLVYQESDDTRQEISCSYRLKDGNRIGFNVANYATDRPLIIDPVLIYSTYLGGGEEDAGAWIAVDSADNAYATGITTSINFPTHNPLQPMSGGGTDSFVTKINACGTALIYSTYLGGSGFDFITGITVDAGGNAYVAGVTDSVNFPLQNALQPFYGGGISDAFVTKINACGSGLVYSTYLGGSDEDAAINIAVDSCSNAYVTGFTASANFSTKNALQPVFGGGEYDAFVTEINAGGSGLVYSTYLGGSGDDEGLGLTVDKLGNAYVTGRTNSANFPTKCALQPSFGGGEFDTFVTRIAACGTGLVYSTYLGGSGQDEGIGIAVDSLENAYVTGFTNSLNFPTLRALQPNFGGGEFDAFVTKISACGSFLIYSTYLGGSGLDEGFGIAVDAFGNANVTGFTNSLNFPTHNPLQPTFGGGPLDAFITKLSASGGCFVYSTYFGGSGREEGISIALDSSGNAYVTGVVNSLDFPTKHSLQPVFSGGLVDAFVIKISSR
ncbi:SBBP repeat-containing protein [Sporomusa aerivorans]|uniref:DUF7948 domain-containing protein n=1 Tax=Sporomusa aerivorans TaxID=204936 RepID=UPI00352A91C5